MHLDVENENAREHVCNLTDGMSSTDFLIAAFNEKFSLPENLPHTQQRPRSSDSSSNSRILLQCIPSTLTIKAI